MAKTTLVRLPILALLKLRDQVDQRLHEHRGDIEKQLQTIQQATVGSSAPPGRSSPLKGKCTLEAA
jgi:hypothetical protein